MDTFALEAMTALAVLGYLVIAAWFAHELRRREDDNREDAK